MKTQKFIILFFSLIAISCNLESQKAEITSDLVNNPNTANPVAEKVLMPNVQISNEIFDFGEMKQGESITHEFIIRNDGQASLIISSAKGSCGCTVPEWPKDPILPSEEAKIKVTFNSAGKSGMQNKTVTLVTNSIPSTKILTIRGNVVIPSKE